MPNGKKATSASITYRAGDQSSGAFGTRAVAGANGGTSAFSAALDAALIGLDGNGSARHRAETGAALGRFGEIPESP